MYYRLKVAGIERDLPLCPINEELYIGAFVLFGDVELTAKCAQALYERAPEHDVLITAESKGIPLVYEMCRLSGRNRYVLARKSVKLYMRDVVACETKSITTGAAQTLYIVAIPLLTKSTKAGQILSDLGSGQSHRTGKSLRRNTHSSVVM